MTNDAAEPRGTRGSSLLMEHVESLDAPPARPTAHERLERLLGKYLSRLLLTALASRRPRAADVD